MPILINIIKMVI